MQALDPDLFTAAISGWLSTRTTMPAERQAIAVDGKTLGGSRTIETTARHILAACDQGAGVVLASTDVDGRRTRSLGSARSSTRSATCAAP
ncbi:hypothetical protein [Micromonospora sp. NPDC005324]|uniref:hypothetical protein n=1 Tax=Micromonospora sp. NPDC005324 TaxID=3157033 RepID=UPI0033A6F5A6